MGMITTFWKDKAWDIKYSKNPDSGVYFTDLESHVKFNCKNFKIQLDKLENYYDDGNFIKEFETFFVVTSRVDMKYSQNIFLDSAARGDIYEFAETMPKKISERIFKIAHL